MICKMGFSGAKEVKFNTGLPLLQEKNLIELKLIDGVPTNKAVGAPFLGCTEKFWQMCQKFSIRQVG